MGIPAVISSNGYGLPIRPVLANAPVMTLSSNGFGTPIVISDNGAPFILQGYDPEDFWDWQTFSLTNGDGGQWVGYSDGGATRPQPAFGSISAQPTSRTKLLALYDDTASGVVLAVFAGNYVSQLDGLQISIGGYVLNSFEVELISGNTWVRFEDMPGVWTPGDVYEVLFGFNLIQGPFPITNSILGAGGLDYALYDSSALDRMWQDSTGQTPAVLTSPVGLIVGREKQAAKTFAQVMEGQPELVTNGTFNTDLSGWSAAASTAPSTVIWSAGRAVAQTDGIANARFRTSFPTQSGKMYQVVIDGTMSYSLGTSNGGSEIRAGIQPATAPILAFVAQSSTTWVNVTTNTNGAYFETVSVKEVPAHYASQATGVARPVLQATGLSGDGSDDNLLSDWLAQSGNNCIIMQGDVPATLAATQIIAGSSQAADAGSIRLGVTTGGLLRATVNGTTGDGVTDLRGKSVVVALSVESGRFVTFADALQERVTTGVFAPNNTVPLRIGANSVAGVAANFFGGSVKRIAFGKVPLDLAQFQQIRAEWLAAA